VTINLLHWLVNRAIDARPGLFGLAGPDPDDPADREIPVQRDEPGHHQASGPAPTAARGEGGRPFRFAPFRRLPPASAHEPA